MSSGGMSGIYNWFVPGATFIAVWTGMFSGIFANNGSFMLIVGGSALAGAALGYLGLVVADQTTFGWPVMAKTALYAAAGALIAQLIAFQVFSQTYPLANAVAGALFANYGFSGQWWPSTSAS